MWILVVYLVVIASTVPIETETDTDIENQAQAAPAAPIRAAPDNDTTNCKDTLSDCSRYQKLCTNERYKHVMITQCAKTCNLCETPCLDRTPRCVEWNNNGFCSSQFYPSSMKEFLCAQTCKICDSPGSTTSAPTSPK
ncbi:hypothetical protein RB195_003735 [Necator americanus]|uniref:ShKT domain-containing protein n=1 Tax=Necator americanus TaxID=51031 RepID=A0ABR1DPY2_NECAM